MISCFSTSPLAFLLPLLLPIALVSGNTEKAIFVAPALSHIPHPHVDPSFEHLCLDRLSLQKPKLQKTLSVQFPTKAEPEGRQSWYLIKNILPGRRYEVKVCWAATQPTTFKLSTFTTNDVFFIDGLLTSLNAYAQKQQGPPCLVPPEPPRRDPPDTPTSIIFLQIQAAADFYSSNKASMSNPPAVLVDIILDPYIFNVLPRSLATTGVYIIIVAVAAYILSGRIYAWLQSIANSPSTDEKSKAS